MTTARVAIGGDDHGIDAAPRRWSVRVEHAGDVRRETRVVSRDVARALLQRERQRHRCIQCFIRHDARERGE